MYHASRVIYWIQHQSTFPYETHNDRQTVFTFGSELFFLWPVLLTKSELIGRMVFWLGFPCAAVGQYFLLRVMKLNRSLALIGVLILISTPIVSRSSVGLKPEMWTVVALLATAYWAVALCIHPERIQLKCFLLGIFKILSINMRPLALALIPSIVAIPLWVVGSAAGRLIRLRAVAAGLLCAFRAELPVNSIRIQSDALPQHPRSGIYAEGSCGRYQRNPASHARDPAAVSATGAAGGRACGFSRPHWRVG